jgi:hypothetical protein
MEERKEEKRGMVGRNEVSEGTGRMKKRRKRRWSKRK